MYEIKQCKALCDCRAQQPPKIGGGSLFHPSVCLSVVDVGSVEGLAYHRAWDTLYWTSSTSSTISRKTVDPKRAGAFSRQAVVTLSEEDHPHVLALDECQKSVTLSFFLIIIVFLSVSLPDVFPGRTPLSVESLRLHRCCLACQRDGVMLAFLFPRQITVNV